MWSIFAISLLYFFKWLFITMHWFNENHHDGNLIENYSHLFSNFIYFSKWTEIKPQD